MSAYSEALAKREWAEHHIQNLEAALLKFRQSDPCGIATKNDPETGDLTYYVSRVPVIPVEIPLIIGDILHNLRCSLDYLASGLVGGSRMSSDAKFPIRSTSANDWEVSGLRMVRGASQEALEVLRRLRPYEGGDPRFVTLQTLNNIDKHRLLLTVCPKNTMQVLSEGGQFVGDHLEHIGTVRLGSGVYAAVYSSDDFPQVPLYAGQELLTVPASQAHQQVGFAIEVAFSEPALAKRMPVAFTIEWVKGCVERATDELAPFLT
jgi:hypothetical protein